MWKLTTSPEDAPNDPERLTIEFKGGLPVKVVLADSKTYTDAVDIFLALNAIARKHGVGRIDIVENRFIGVKSRGCYESPAATILRVAHMDLEGLTLDRNVRALRDQFVTVQLSQILYNGYFFSPERELVTSCIPTSQRTVNGTVRLKLYKGNVVVEGRFSDEVSIPVIFSLTLISITPNFFHLGVLPEPAAIKHTDSKSVPLFRVFTTRSRSRWTNLVALNQLIRQDSFKSSRSGLKSASMVAWIILYDVS